MNYFCRVMQGEEKMVALYTTVSGLLATIGRVAYREPQLEFPTELGQSLCSNGLREVNVCK